jgi:hypothetical protein
MRVCQLIFNIAVVTYSMLIVGTIFKVVVRLGVVDILFSLFPALARRSETCSAREHFVHMPLFIRRLLICINDSEP